MWSDTNFTCHDRYFYNPRFSVTVQDFNHVLQVISNALLVQLAIASCVVSLASDILTPLQCTDLFKQVWQRTVTELLASVEARRPSFRVRWRRSCSVRMSIRYWLERLVLGSHGWPIRSPSRRHEAPHNIECISMTSHVFCTRPYCSDQSDELGHKMTHSEKYFLYNIVI